ncbi:MAG: phosphopyruvate hydratase [Alphaproteobacteria bacterium]|nr:phosphopyruvate hydratase [Alphaproteobacteria bacterium]
MSRLTIAAIEGRQIFDSRGRPTVEVDVRLEGGAVGRASVPSGASTGRNEAHELRDGDKAAFDGLGVTRAVAHVNGEIARAINGHAADDQPGLDQRLCALDGSPNLHRLGANAVLGVSLAACRAAAIARGVALYRHIGTLAGVEVPVMPLPMVNLLSGGLHAGGGMDLQDFLIVPVGAASYSEALAMTLAVRAKANELSRARGLPTLLADEGGLSPGFKKAAAALDFAIDCIDAAGYTPGVEIALALDMAASGLLQPDGTYGFDREGVFRRSDALIDLIAGWVERYPIVSIEDALAEEAWADWTALTARLPGLQLVGDDLLCTQPARISRAVRERAANAALIKLNQNGTLSGTIEAVKAARAGGFATVISARSGETEDSFLADFAVGIAGGQIKIGSVRASERLAKYNQLLRIEAELGGRYAGRSALAPLG